MKLEKVPYEPGALADFFGEGLQALGAVCERTWHDRVEVLAEGEATRVWSVEGGVIETEVRFAGPGDTTPKDAARDAFPGCPLIFRLAEILAGKELALERCALEFTDHLKAPSVETATKTWQAQFPNTTHWEQLAPFRSGWTFALLGIVRCEIQAIDQHWSLHRVAISLPGGGRDEHLAANLDFAQATSAELAWPASDLPNWSSGLSKALEEESSEGLAAIKRRQEAYLRRELERIDTYFATYEQELRSRSRAGKEAALKLNDRLAATHSEHQRRREDQVRRHQIHVIPHVDALMLIAEPCWSARIRTVTNRAAQAYDAEYLPRARSWKAVAERKPEGTRV